MNENITPTVAASNDRVTVYIDLTKCGYRTGPRTLSHTPAYAELMAGKMTEVAHGLGLLGVRDIDVGWPEVDGWMAVTVDAADVPAVKIAYASPPTAQVAEYEAYKRAEVAHIEARKALSVTMLDRLNLVPLQDHYATTVPRSFVRRLLDRVRGWFR